MHKPFLAFLVILSAPLAACQSLSTIPPSPIVVANSTVLDEKGAIAVETAYTAAARAASLAIRLGLVKDRATIAKIGQLDNQAYAAVLAVRAAYDAGNATSYAAAFAKANGLVKQILLLIGPAVSEVKPVATPV